ncbi:MAG: MBL fold metallo-hydrolase [Alphaproteobacteria bacterium]|nr:MBL fold metallo-hydrolase [Alphaproteobacteria bacterium]
MRPEFDVIHMPPENTNSVLVSMGGDCVIFDAWGRADDWVRLLDERGLRLRAIYTTHGHPDHFSAAPFLAAHYNVPWFLATPDDEIIPWGNSLLDYFGLPHVTDDNVAPTPLVGREIAVLPELIAAVVPAPGHSPGGVMFHFAGEKVLISGDTIFADSVGRWDLPGGDLNTLRTSIARVAAMNLPDDTRVIHGHGPDSTIGGLRRYNPYFK